MMATRWMLLIVASGLFMAAWSGDRPIRASDSDKMLARRCSSPCLANAILHPSRIASKSKPASKSDQRGLISKRPAMLQVSSIPLPHGIKMGTYLIVDRNGQTGTRIVTTEESRRANSSQSQDLNPDESEQFVVRHGSQRWHFIQIESGPKTVAEHLLPAKSTERVANL